MKINWIRNFILLSRYYYKRLIFLFIIMLISILFDVLSIGSIIPLINYFILDTNNYSNLLPANDFISKLDEKEIYIFSVIIIFVLFILKNLFLLVYTKISANFIAYLTIYHEQMILSRILSKDYSYFLKKNSSFFIREFQNEIKLLNDGFIQPVLTIILNSITIISFAIFLLILYPKITIISFIFAILFFLVFVYSLKSKFKFMGNQRRTHQLKILNVLKQIFEGIRELKIYNRERVYVQELNKSWYRLGNLAATKQIFTVLPKASFEIFLVIGIVIAILISKDPVSLLPVFAIFVIVLLRLIPTVNSLIHSFQRMNYSQPALDNLIVFFDEQSEVNNKKDLITFSKKIEFNNVCFKHQNEIEVFKNMNLIINKNTCVGIKGDSGSGKSTLVDILSGLLSIQSGKILVDDKELKKENLNLWTKKFSYIQQKIYFFEDSLEFNISLEKEKKNIDYDKLNKIIELVQLKDFLDERGGDLSTKLEVSASNISGGQAQRLGIARALYKSPEIIIFDEAFNNLDNKNLTNILKLIGYLKKNSTIIMISHLDKTFFECDEIYEVEDKKLNKIK